MVSEAKNNRNAMPTVAAFVDEIRAQGISCRVLYASENGNELGKKPEYVNVHNVPRVYRSLAEWKQEFPSLARTCDGSQPWDKAQGESS